MSDDLEAVRQILEWDGDFDDPDDLPDPLVYAALHDPYVNKAVDQIRHRDLDPVKALTIAVCQMAAEREAMLQKVQDHLEREPQVTEMVLEDDDE